MMLIQLLMVRRYTLKTESITSYLTLIALAQTREFDQVGRMFSKRFAVEELVRVLNDNH
ncbi:gp107 [Erwinia phage vB_EamP-S6]|uniref:Gp107 n=1 Tax=Erwinia phage vB_EamP-S6 TaxID=1051675 RepID=G0YQJ9_9CAUD|nr:gp107 [Erwinia phage vB_EamP-S6]AEJ81626.1 gp107 [Erwinia phage vB_EamP-S6]